MSFNKKNKSVLNEILSNYTIPSPNIHSILDGNLKLKNSEVDRNPIHFWDTIGTRMYSGMAAKLESDQPAYAFIYNLAISYLRNKAKPTGSFKGLKILDFGCHNGSSTSIYSDLTAQGVKVIGVDSNPIVIAEAQLKFSDVIGLEFKTILKNNLLPYNNIDITLATFVHPTISKQSELEQVVKNIFFALKPGGMAVFLGLNPKSFGKEYRSYKHQLMYGPYEDSHPFRNTLVLPDGSSLSFDDYCWTNHVMENIFKNIGFIELDIISLTRSLQGEVGDLFMSSLSQVEERFGIKDWQDEWGTNDAPHDGLFTVYIAFKPNA